MIRKQQERSNMQNDTLLNKLASQKSLALPVTQKSQHRAKATFVQHSAKQLKTQPDSNHQQSKQSSSHAYKGLQTSSGARTQRPGGSKRNKPLIIN